jgi:Zn-dependent protease
MNLRWGRHGEAVVAASGPISNLVMAALVAVPLRLILDSPELYNTVATSNVLKGLFQVALAFLQINVFLCIFNLLPVPPLDGWHVLMGLVPPQTAWTLRSFERQYAAIIPVVFLLFFILAAPKIIVPIADTLIRFLLGIR